MFDVLAQGLPWLAAMAALVVCSAFFSGSEAALFFLRPADRRILRRGTRSQRMADQLLEDPDRVLSAVLFWNLVINVAYFAMASEVALQIEQSAGGRSQAQALGFGLTALLTLIFFSEMLPKSLAVTNARVFSSIVSYPLAVAARLVDPLMPVLQTVNLLSRRVLWPSFKSEPYLQLNDLERAIDHSTQDANLIEQERTSLRNLVQLSDVRVDEWMRPRTHFMTFSPPVSLADLEGKMTPSGFMLVTEADSDEVSSSIDLKELFDVPDDHLEYRAMPVVVVPWCASVADAMEELQRKERKVAAIVNEFGHTIGILTIDDILDLVFQPADQRSDQLWNRAGVKLIRPGIWHVTGITSLRHLARTFEVDLPNSRSVTLTGCIQESLQRVAEVGDLVDWGPLHFRVIEAPARGLLLVEVTRNGEPTS